MSDSKRSARDIDGGLHVLRTLMRLSADLLQFPILCYAGMPTRLYYAESQIHKPIIPSTP
jgi:hypothetical protein